MKYLFWKIARLRPAIFSGTPRNLKAWFGWFGLVDAFHRKVSGYPRGILPHVQTGYWESRLACLIQTIGNPDWSG